MQPRRIRVLSLIGDLSFGGGENRLLAFAENIDRQRFEHTVVTVNRVDPTLEEVGAMYDQFRASGVNLMDLGGARGGGTRSLLGKGILFSDCVRRLARIIRRLDIEIVDTHLEVGAMIGVAASVVTARHSVVTLYHAHALDNVRLWQMARHFVFARAEMIITDSIQRGQEIQEAALFGRPRVAIVPNGLWPPERKRSIDEVRRALGIPADPGTRVVGQVSALRSFKGQMVLLDAAREVLKTRPEAFFLMVGYVKDGSDFPDALRTRASDLGIADRVSIASYPGSIGDVWSVIDIHVHSSLFDSLPNAIIEGMSLGKPAVVTAVGGIPDAVLHGKSGLVVPPGDPVQLAEALVTLLGDSGHAARLGTAARERYEENYRADLMCRRIEACLTSALSSRRATGHLWNESTGIRYL